MGLLQITKNVSRCIGTFFKTKQSIEACNIKKKTKIFRKVSFNIQSSLTPLVPLVMVSCLSILSPQAVYAEGAWQVGLSEGESHKQPLYAYNASDKSGAMFVDILSAGEVINVLVSTATTVQIYDPIGTRVVSQSVRNVSTTENFNQAFPPSKAFQYTTLTSGTYEVRFVGGGNQSRFDISVTSSTSDLVDPRINSGRVWFRDLYFNTGSFSEAYSTDANLYAVASGGFTGTYFVWKLDLNNFAGFVYRLLANDLGVNSPNASNAIVAGLSVRTSGNSATAKYPIYFSYPAKTFPRPSTTPSVTNYYFLDDAGVDSSISPPPHTVGIQDTGDFYFTTNLTDAAVYELIVDTGSPSNSSTPDGLYGEGDVFLRGIATAGQNKVHWNGKNNNGQAVAIGSYTSQVVIRTGEFHFVAWDAESSGGNVEGLTIEQAISDLSSQEVKVYWDDKSVLGLNNANAFNQEGILGGHHTWGNFTGGGDGNQAFLDTYVYGEISAFSNTSISVKDNNTPELDYGDAPESFGDAGHEVPVTPTVYLGTNAPDREENTQNAGAGKVDGVGDDNDVNGDDEDGVSAFPDVDASKSSYTLPAANITVHNQTGANATLYGFIDFNSDGDFNDTGESITQVIANGATQPSSDLVWTGYATANVSGSIYARFRISTESNLTAVGNSIIGEVEDYSTVSLVVNNDYGDIPASYGDATHKILETPLVYLGAVAPDGESASANPLDGTGDDGDSTDDEDAFSGTLPELVINDTSYSLNVACIGESATVAGWVDFNRNGSFDSGERSSNTCSTGTATLSWSSISGMSVGTTYVRLRIASNAGDIANPNTGSGDGEVEDYTLEISNLKPTEFVCDGKPYTVIGNPSILQEMNKSTLAVSSLGNFNPAIKINGIGYNTLDNFIYGYADGKMYRAGYNREIEDLGVPTGSGAFDPNTATGTMDTAGNFYGINDKKIFILNIGNNPASGTLTYTTISRSGKKDVLLDIAFSPVDGKLYGMKSGKLIQIDPASGVGTQVSTTGSGLSGNAGGAWSSADGSVYLYNNTNGRLFKVDTSQTPPVASDLGSVAQNGSFDATACIPPSLQKDASVTDTTIGDVFDYTFTINNPNTTSINVSINDTLPTYLTFVSGSLSSTSPGGGSVGTFNDTQLSINRISVVGSSKLEFTVSVKVALTAPEGDIDNQARLIYGSNTYLSDDPDTGAIEDPTRVTVVFEYDYGDAPDDSSDFKYGVAKHRVTADPDLSLGSKKPAKDKASDYENWKREWDTNGKHKNWFKNNKTRRGHGNGHRKKNEVEDPAPDVVGDGAEEDGLVTTALSWNNGTVCTGLLPDGTTGSITMTDTRYCVTVTASNNSAVAAQLVGWIDFNQNGEFDDPLERSVADLDADTSNDDTQGNVPAGTDNQPIVIYWENQTKISGELNTYIRLRLTSDPEFKSNNSPDPIGVAINGEVEDTNIGINVTGTDFGDAPDSYGDASHIIELDAYMGTTIDNDIVSQNAANGGTDGVGDDNDGYNDDDGVASFPAIDTNAQTYSVDITVTSPTTEDANLVGWIDFDGNGVFDTDEATTVTVPQSTTESVVTLTWSSIPTDIQGGSVYVRLRLTTDTSVATGTASSSLPTGLATDGEVEDYSLDIIVGWPVAPVTGPGDGGQCLLTHHTNVGVAADPNSFYNISDHTNPSTLTKIGPWNIPSGTVEGLTADRANEVFYALNANRSGKLWLGKVDPITGSFSDITTVGSSTLSHSTHGTLSIEQSRAIAHQPGTNTLWLAAYNAQPSSGPGSTYVYLFKMNTSTGEVMTGAFSGEDYLAIELAPYTFNNSNDRPTIEALTFYKNEPNILYGVLSTYSGGSPLVGHLFAVDISKTDPQAVLAPNNLSGVSYSGGAAPSSDYYDIEGMSFDANGDLVIVSSNVGGANANSLLTVNLTTGIASNKRTIISGDWEGIVCDPPFAEKDFGDAPSDMSSIDASLTAVYGEAGHVLDGTTYLGVLADSESGSQDTGLNADGDDVNGSDDDDGVVFPLSGSLNVLRVGQANTITVTASTAGTLNAWIDWNQDGDWDDAGEQIATDLSLVSGANVLSVMPLTTYVQGKTYARFRFSSIAGLSSTGLVADGEVEDYAVNLTLATPVNVCSPTLLNNGFENPTVPSGLIIQLEDTIEGWSTQAVNPASGSSYSDRNVIEIWESGFNGVPAYQGNQFAELNAYVSGALYQDVELAPGTTVGWSFAHRARSGTDTIKVLMGSPDALIEQGQYTSGTGAWEVYSGSYTVPSGQTVTRFSFQSVDAGSVGNFIDAIELPGGCDFGDAPDSYLTKLSSDGAHHISNSLLYLGTEFADSEEAAFGGDDTDSSGTASDDDNEGDRPDDEDGVVSFDEIDDLDTAYSTAIIVKNTTGSAANLVGWIDFDGNGIFDTDEAATVAIPNNTNGILNLNWNNIPSDITSGDTFVRLRLTTDNSIATGDATTSIPSGMAKDGEIEDYPIFIKVGGFPVKGRVYNDSNVDGINDNSEVGISDLPVVLLDVTNGTCISVRTDADGKYEFFPVIPGDYRLYEASRETVPTPQNCNVSFAKDPANYRSTTNNAFEQFSVVDAEINGKDFGDIQGPTFEPDNTGSILAGNVEFYAHKFTAKSTGSVDFISSSSGGATVGWSSVIYQDLDCNGQLETAEANAPVASNLATIAGQDICLINKVYAPTGVSAGETFSNIISADFNFNNNALAGTTTLKVTDLSKAAANDPVLGSSKLELRKTVQNITQSSAETETQNQAKPGDTLKYRIYYSNTGTGSITDLEIKDVVPAFTTLSGSPDCETPLPASLTSCSGNVSGGNIEWTFGVGDVLDGGAQGVVSYEVIID